MKFAKEREVEREKIRETEGLYLKPFMSMDILTQSKNEVRVDHQKLILEPGAKDRYHYHKHTYDLFTVQRGEASILLNDEKIKLEKGDLILVEPGDRHMLYNPTEERGEVIETRLNVVGDDKEFVKSPL